MGDTKLKQCRGGGKRYYAVSSRVLALYAGVVPWSSGDWAHLGFPSYIYKMPRMSSGVGRWDGLPSSLERTNDGYMKRQLDQPSGEERRKYRAVDVDGNI